MDYSKILKQILSLILCLVVISSCSRKKEAIIDVSPEFIEYITAYSGGVLSKNSAIQIELAHPHPDAEKNKVIESSLFQFKPSLKGVTTWIDEQTIQFTPTQEMSSSTYYKAQFNLGNLIEVPANFQRFEFGFYTREIDLSIDVSEIISYSQTPDKVAIEAIINSSDDFKLEEIKPLLSVEDNKGKKVEYTLTAQSSESYIITIPEVDKSSCDWVSIKLEAKKLGAENDVEQSITIPDNNTFELIDSRRLTQPMEGVRLTFSEPLREREVSASFLSVEGGYTYTIDQEDNRLYLYFEEGIDQAIRLKIHENFTSLIGNKISKEQWIELPTIDNKPEIELLTKGTILPNSSEQNLHFRARGVEAVDIHVVKVYSSNLLHFLQINELNQSNQIKRSGRLVLKKRINLDKINSSTASKWRDYAIDLADLFSQEPGALYHIGLSFKRDYTIYNQNKEIANSRDGSIIHIEESVAEVNEWDDVDTYYSGLQLGEPYDWSIYEWRQRMNPQHPTFYMSAENVSVTTNLYATHLGVIAKQNSSGKLWVTVNNILTTKPVESAKVKVFSYQLQLIGEQTTNADGFAEVNCKGQPFIVQVESGGEKSYLRIPQGTQLSTSRFDVGGVQREKGLKGFIYGERGVWRPGDTLHISFIVEDREKRIPENHPVSLELFNPQGQFYTKQLATKQEGGIYYFAVPTNQSDPTGLWNGYVKIGGSTFHKSFRIETIKPNRLKIDLSFAQDILSTQKSNAMRLRSNWLTGSVANGLNASIELILRNYRSPFPTYDRYLFTDLTSSFVSTRKEVFKGELNSNGEIQTDLDLPISNTAPGMLKGQFITRVYEPGGDISIHSQEMSISPFKTYVGLAMPKSDEEINYLETDTKHTFDVISLTEHGKPNPSGQISYEIYKVGWSWWFDKEDVLTNYIQNSSVHPIQKGDLSVNQAGKTSFSFGIDYPEYGPYLIYLKDKNSGHTVSQSFFIDWPSWRGRADRPNPTGLTMLSFNLDKEEYQVGEEVTVTLPAASKGRALISIEDGNGVIKQEWIKTKEGEDTLYRFKTTAAMAPNVYVFVSLLQAHEQTINDSPIRMYGVMPVLIHNSDSKLAPEITMPKVLAPEKPFTIQVKENKGKAMAYTLAIVDEGLLDLTSYKTPNPWSYFYAKEALGVSTWDMYDEVIGAMAGTYKKLFSVGGDEMLNPADAKVNRFNPVVEYLGPFSLEKGETAQHTIELPMYVGSVRTMVVASSREGFGSAEQTTVVRAPLMLLSSLPRTLTINEEVWLPVNLFVMDESINEVEVTIKSSSNIEVVGGNSRRVKFNKTGDQPIYFKLKVGHNVGVENITILASSGAHKTSEEIEIAVRNPNPLATQIKEAVIGAGEKTTLNYSFESNETEKKLELEVARIPSINLTSRLQFLNSYPHESTEQIVSKAFPLLYIEDLIAVEAPLKEKSKETILETIQKLYSRQASDGSFTYWNNSTSNYPWVTAYAALFLTKAKEQGYPVHKEVLSRWRNYQSRIVRQWSASASSWMYSRYNQAYALYVLAVSGNADLAAMNRLKEDSENDALTKWTLAAAYAWLGKDKVANELVFNLSTEVTNYNPINTVFGSSLRDEAFILQTLLLLKQNQKAFKQAHYLAKRIKEETYYQTQSTALALIAMADYSRVHKSQEMNFNYNLSSTKPNEVRSQQILVQKDLEISNNTGQLSIENKSDGTLYTQLIQSSYLITDNLPAITQGLSVNVRYRDMNGNPLAIDKLKQGTDFIAWVEVKSMGREVLKEIALTHIIPTGWEVYNTRVVNSLTDEVTSGQSTTPRLTYQDVRDDRILSYFDLNPEEVIRIPIRLQALYAGKFILPAVRVEQMYNSSIQGRTAAGSTEVVR